MKKYKEMEWKYVYVLCTHLNYKSAQFSNSEIGVTQSQKSVTSHIAFMAGYDSSWVIDWLLAYMR